MRWTWAVIGGVAALLVLAVVDSFRSLVEVFTVARRGARRSASGG
jgi:hypothetical protein